MRDSGRPIVVGVAAIGAGVVRVATGMVERSIIAGVIATLSVSLGAWPVVWLAISLLTAGGAAYPLRRRHKRAVDLRARAVAARWGPERQKREAAAVAAMVAMRARRDDERRRGVTMSGGAARTTNNGLRRWPRWRLGRRPHSQRHRSQPPTWRGRCSRRAGICTRHCTAMSITT